MIIRELSPGECRAVFAANRSASLACSHDDRPYVVPIFYAHADGCAYAFTMLGRKLETMRANPNVALLVEHIGEGRTWTTVVAEGRFEELADRIGHKRERDRAWSLLSTHANWWEPGALKPAMPALADHSSHVFFRIHLDAISGREAVHE